MISSSSLTDEAFKKSLMGNSGFLYVLLAMTRGSISFCFYEGNVRAVTARLCFLSVELFLSISSAYRIKSIALCID